MSVQLSRKLLASSMPDAMGFILRGFFFIETWWKLSNLFILPVTLSHTVSII